MVRIIFIIALLVAAARWPLTAAAQTPLPIVNSDFEIGSHGDTPPTGWTNLENFFWIGDHSDTGGDPGTGYLSSQFISASWAVGGLSSASSLAGGDANAALLRQDIDLSPYSSVISAGNTYLGVSYAYFHNDSNDLGTISYDFLDSSDSIIGSGYAGQTSTGGGWTFVEDLGAAQVPTNAAKLRITLGAERVGVGSQRNIAFDTISASLQPPPPPETRSDFVNGNLIQFDGDGNWTWYTDERAIVDSNNGHVMVNSVGFSPSYVDNGQYLGVVEVVNFDPQTGRRVRTQLSNLNPANPNSQRDDHNVGALLELPDGRYLAMYSNHGNNGGLGDEYSRWRVSNNPGDSTSWTTEQLFNWYDNVPGANETGNPDAANVAYHNLFYLSAEDQVYDISRSYGQLSTNGASQNVPNILRYDVGTNSVEWAGQLLETQAGGYSAYPKYATNGVDRIYFVTTETHPRNYNNSIYSGYIENGQTFDMEGNLIDPNVFDNGTTAGGSGFVSDATDFSLVQQSDPLGEGYNRMWTTDLALDSNGQPMALFTSRWDPDGSTDDGSTTNPIDHRLHYAHWNSQTGQWETHELAQMGDRLYSDEQDYTGLGALVPGDPNTLYISTQYDPREFDAQTPKTAPDTPFREIYKGVTADGGTTWSWTPITENSGVDNLRPLVPDPHGGDPTVIWFRGTYTTAGSIDAAVVGIVDRSSESLGLDNYIDANASNTQYASGAALQTSTPSGSSGPLDNLWHERTGYGNGGSVLTSSETGFEDAPMLETTIDGSALEDGTYDIFAYFWSDNDEDWRLMAGLESNNLIDFRRYGSQFAEEDQFATIETVSANDNDLLLYRAYLGRVDLAGGADITVFIDDWQSPVGDAIRTWYDGVGFALVSSSVGGLAGDYNENGVVDAADYTVWRDHFGTMYDLPNRNPGNTGVVSEADFTYWRANFGNGSSGNGSLASVPEPAAAVMLALALLPLCIAGRRPSLHRQEPTTVSSLRVDGKMTPIGCRQAFLVAALVTLVALGSTPARAVETQSYVTSVKALGQFTLAEAGRVAPLHVDSADWPGVVRLAGSLQADIARVSGTEPRLLKDEAPTMKEVVLIGTLGRSPTIDRLVKEGKLDATGVAGEWDAFVLQVVENPLPGVDRALVIAGGNKRGTIYGMFGLSAQIGVSPWYWWADVPVEHKNPLYIDAGRYIDGPPAVKYRGIFLNDEGWALSPWVNEKFGNYNSKFYAKVFELLLRLKGNYLWPAMWNNAFNEDDPENPRLADELGIVMGTSHQEPMLRAQKEWDRRYQETLGHWNYYTHANVLEQFWREGLRRNKDYESIITMGLRGANDSPMIPNGTVDESMELLKKIVEVQRQMIVEEIDPDPSQVPQLWCPYKEVQEYFEHGLRVPDDVTILWCDDNWGNIRRVPTPEERKRSGGAGMYYHFDFHGGPRSYEWLNSTEIAKVREQLNLAYRYGADRVWIVNVGDLKPMEYPLSFFFDYAWDPNRWPAERLPEYARLWAAQQFGPEHASEIADLLTAYTHYNAQRKPELLDPGTYSMVNFQEGDRIVDQYNQLAARAKHVGSLLGPEYQDAYFELVLYPIEACANLNELYVTAAKNQLYAAQGRAATNRLATRVKELFDRDAELARQYNKDLAGGKWNHMMDTTHIGYTSWDPPRQNNMPRVEELELSDKAGLGVVVEGSASAWPGETKEPALEFTRFGARRRYIDVFNRGTEPFEFSAAASQPWIELSSSGDTVDDQQRLWVTIDWNKAPAGDARGEVKLSGAGTDVTVTIDANNETLPDDVPPGTFLEGDGCVSIDAVHFTGNVPAGPVRWEKVPGYGRALASMTIVPVTGDSVTPPTDSPCLEYRMYLFHAGTVTVEATVAPTLNFVASRDLRLAVSFDEQPQTVTVVPKDYVVDYSNNDWQDAVRNSARFVKSTHMIDGPGTHTLKVWMVDPGVVLQKVVVETGHVAPSYLGPPESCREGDK